MSRRDGARSGSGLKRHRSRSESTSSLPGGSPAGSSSRGHERKEQKRKKREVQQIQQIQHLESLKMRLNRKTAFLTYLAMKMPENSLPTPQPKGFGCHWGRRSKLCNAHEDPMYDIIRENKRHEKEMRIQQLKQLLEDSTSDEDSSSSSSSSSSSGYKGKHKKKRKRKEKRKKKRKHKSSKPSKRSKLH
ncbi:retinitis pigmentosa 9 protein isoform X2 [Zootoca vivipara]|uniref:retinitis pigmentosa 9 protein isoform X2 n=1 Tax=Zootoca vivipara TaxID=8524 RepID=UPI00293BBF38|nr:retinitis pigmentosa 9 protein isoform X2 [Zootoca vivipara]